MSYIRIKFSALSSIKSVFTLQQMHFDSNTFWFLRRRKAIWIQKFYSIENGILRNMWLEYRSDKHTRPHNEESSVRYFRIILRVLWNESFTINPRCRSQVKKLTVHLNWIKVASSPCGLDSSTGREPDRYPEGASSNPAWVNFFSWLRQCRLIVKFSFQGKVSLPYPVCCFQ